MSRPVLIDTDPGIDDAIALLLALRCPELEVRGVTTVGGNVAVERCTANAAKVLALGGVKPGALPLHQGARTALAANVKVVDEPIHGGDGLGEARIPPVEWPVPERYAVDWLLEQVTGAPGELTLIGLGPCTNLAQLLQRLPNPGLIKEIILMGGSVGAPGNTNPVAEYNLWADPEAARVVLHAGVPVRLVGLNVTRKALLHAADTARLADSGPVGLAVAQMASFYIERYERIHGVAACAMHDPLAVAVGAQPDLCTWRSLYVDVECRGELTRGMSVADLMGRLGKAPNVQVAVDVDAERFRTFLLERLLG